MPPKMAHSQAQAGFSLPLPYTLFFLLIEPLSALVGAFYAQCQQPTYLTLLSAPSADLHPAAQGVPVSTSVALSQLANMYLFFALNEALVLRATADIRVWRAVLLVLLVADFGHLYAMKGLGLSVFYRAWEWNAAGWGNIGFVYAGAMMRTCFLTGVGMGTPKTMQTKKQ